LKLDRKEPAFIARSVCTWR